MKRAKQTGRLAHRVYSFGYFLLFFLLIALLMTINFFLFLTYVDVDRSQLLLAAPVTFGNVVFLSLICSLIDYLRRIFTVERPVRKILETTDKLAAGDFSARAEPPGFPGTRELAAIAENLNKMAGELSGIETLRTDFISNVSHELKTPLAVIQNYATVLQSPDLTEEQRVECAKTVGDAARRLTDLITNILKLNKLENQQIFPEVKPYDLSEQLCECLLNFETVWEDKALEIDTDIQPDITVEADGELMSLVWNNLFSNAMKFTETGGKVSVSLREEVGQAVVKVSDTGCGIPPETQKHIFEKFYQGDTSHATAGNGLGLALAKRVIDITHGEIAVESEPGKGSTFTVRLRAAP